MCLMIILILADVSHNNIDIKEYLAEFCDNDIKAIGRQWPSR